MTTIRTKTEKYKIEKTIVTGTTIYGQHPASLSAAKSWTGINWIDGFLIMMDDDFVYGFFADEDEAFNIFCEYAN